MDSMQMYLGFLTVGPGELAVIAIIALVIFGPEKLPEIGKQIGMAYRELNRLRGDVNRALGDIQDYTRFDLPDYSAPAEQRYTYSPPSHDSDYTSDYTSDDHYHLEKEAAMDAEGSQLSLPAPPETPADVASASVETPGKESTEETAEVEKPSSTVNEAKDDAGTVHPA